VKVAALIAPSARARDSDFRSLSSAGLFGQT